MSIRNAEEAARAAEQTKTNAEGMCQAVTRGYYLAPSAGDQDRDGDADAKDGWLSEPKSARHTDRNPPRGYPCTMSTGGHWHRLESLGKKNGVTILRSTDFDGVTKRFRPGVLGNGTIEEIELAMGAKWVGWSRTIDGVPIPPAPKKPVVKKPAAKRSHGEAVDHAIADLMRSKKGPASGARARHIHAALAELVKVPEVGGKK